MDSSPCEEEKGKQEWLATGSDIQEIGAGKGKLNPGIFIVDVSWSFGGGEGVAPRFFRSIPSSTSASDVFKGGIAPNLESKYMNRDSTSSFNRVK